MKILIGTPVYDAQVTIHYHVSLMQLVADLRARLPGVSVVHGFPSSALIANSRNALVSQLLADESFTHLLFVDSDMGFRPSLVRKMFEFDQPVVGAVYPRRGFGPSGQDFIGEQDALKHETGALIVRRGFLKMKRLGTGVMLIQRNALEKLRQAHPELIARADASYRGLGVEGEVLQIFESLPAPNGIYQGEDYAFSQRWRDIGGELWACVDEAIVHVGRHEFSGDYLTKIRRQFGDGSPG